MTHYPVLIVGGGHLKARGIDHLVVEKHRAMHSWETQRWDNFCLVTPNWQCALPGHAYAGPDPDGFMVKDEILSYLKGFRAVVDPPIREGVSVNRVQPRGEGGFSVATSAGDFTADAVVVASGGYHEPIVPRMAERLPAGIAQIHSAQYRNAGQLPEGGVLVVGSGQSGAQIAEDLHLAGRKVHMVTGNAPRCARFYRGRDVVDWLWDVGQYDITVADDGMGKKRHDTNHYLTGRDGGRDVDLRAFALQGMSLYGRLSGISGGKMLFEHNLKANLDNADRVYNGINALIDKHIAAKGIEAPAGEPYAPLWEPTAEPTELDLKAEGVGSVVWATGFRADWSFVCLPIFDGAGYPVHRHGVTDIPGVYVLGLPWLWTWGSGRFLSVGRDAEFIVSDLASSRLKVGSPALKRAG